MSSNPLHNWWTRPCGGRDVTRIALPLAISTGCVSVMLFVDRMFLLWHSPAEMAAAMPAGMLYWATVCGPVGVAGYANTFVAQYVGAAREERVGAALWQGFWVGLLATPVFLLLIPLAGPIFAAAGHEPTIQAHETIYFQVLMLGAGAQVMAAALSCFFTGRGETRIVMYVNVATTLLNLGLDALWIFGLLGFPEMGIAGAALGTAVAQWAQVIVYWVLIYRVDARAQYGLLQGRVFDAELFRRLLAFGSPSGLQMLVEAGAFTLVMMKMGQLGALAMAATTLAFNVNTMVFIPMVGVGIAVSTLVGHQLTSGRADLAARATGTAVTMALTICLGFGALYLFAPDLFLLGHKAGTDGAEFAAIRDLTVVLLRFVAAYCLFDALQIILVGAIKGAGDTWFVLGTTIVVATLALTVGWIGAEQFQDQLLWWWCVVTGWILTLAIVYGLRFLQGRWRTMRVIEHPASAADESLPDPPVTA